jgi:protein involved in polysaccharide export with SLBB domain
MQVKRLRLRHLFLCLAMSGLGAGLTGPISAAENSSGAPLNPPPSTNTAFTAVNANTRAAWQQRLTLGPGDILSFGMYGSPELTRTDIVVGPDGRISYLQATDVLVTGLTVDELRDKLDAELSKFYRGAKTMVIPTAYRSKKFYMLGKVLSRGVYYLDRPLTIVEAVAQARGLETGLMQQGTVELADLPRSFLLRQGKRAPVDFERLFQQGDLTQNILVEPEDYIYFPSTTDNAVYVLGEIGRPGMVPIAPQISVISAITTCGGFTSRSYRQRVLVVRGSFSNPKTFTVNTAAILAGNAVDFKLEPKDIVYVSQRPWAQAVELLDIAARSFVNAFVITWTGENVQLITEPLLE